MLLRGSGEFTGDDYSFDGIMDGQSDTGIPYGDLLTRFADAVHAGEFADVREEVRVALGEEALADAAGVIAIFSAVVKVADGIGIPLEDFKADVSAGFREELGIGEFARD